MGESGENGMRPQPSLNELREALAESEQRYRNLFDNSVLGIYRTTPDGQIVMANPALLEMLGYASFEELARRDLEHGDFEPRYSRARFKEKIETEGEIIGLESMWVKRDGTDLFVRENARVVRGADGEALYYEGTVEDISERKRAEEKLRVLLTELSRVAERDRLLSARRIADDVVRVLGSVMASLDGGAGGLEPYELEGAVERAARSVLMIGGELDPPQLEETSLESALGALVAQQNAVAGLRFDFKDDGQPKPLEQDIGYLLLTATRELMLNVIKHARAKRCRVAVSKDGEHVRVTVEDDGVGFDVAASGPISPLGLEGLRERLEASGGKLEVRSSPGRGSKISLLAPLGLSY